MFLIVWAELIDATKEFEKTVAAWTQGYCTSGQIRIPPVEED